MCHHQDLGKHKEKGCKTNIRHTLASTHQIKAYQGQCPWQKISEKTSTTFLLSAWNQPLVSPRTSGRHPCEALKVSLATRTRSFLPPTSVPLAFLSPPPKMDQAINRWHIKWIKHKELKISSILFTVKTHHFCISKLLTDVMPIATTSLSLFPNLLDQTLKTTQFFSY